MIAEIVGEEIRCYNCFQIKEVLKSLGFRWNSENKYWYRDFEEAILPYLREIGVEIFVKKPKEVDPKLYEELKKPYPYALPHQLEAVSLAIQKKSFLIGDEPGAGETLQGIRKLFYISGTG